MFKSIPQICMELCFLHGIKKIQLANCDFFLSKKFLFHNSDFFLAIL